MGFAIAERLAHLGAKVILISGPVNISCGNSNITRINVTSAREMLEQCLKFFEFCNGAIMVAAVADFTPLNFEKQKIKRSAENYFIELTPNPDIAATLGMIKKSHQVLGGFALETNNAVTNAQLKLKKKNLDFIVLNSLQDEGSGFQYDTNKIKIICKNGETFDYELKQKSIVANDVVNKMVDIEDYLTHQS